MHSSNKTHLLLPHIAFAATEAHVLPTLNEYSLLSIGQLCDAGCLATFVPTSVPVTHKDKTILKEQCNDITKLWTTPIATHALESNNSPPKTKHHALNVKLSTKIDALVTFAYCAIFLLSISTPKPALCCNLITIRGVSIEIKQTPPQRPMPPQKDTLIKIYTRFVTHSTLPISLCLVVTNFFVK
jgi:hypothetical protein